MKINSQYSIHYRNKLQNNEVIATNEHIKYILSTFSYAEQRILKVRKYAAFIIKSFLDCLLITNQIETSEHRQYLNKLELYVNCPEGKCENGNELIT